MKGLRRAWGISLIVLGLNGVVTGLNGLLPAGLPDVLARGMGALALIALAVFAYTTVRLYREKKRK